MAIDERLTEEVAPAARARPMAGAGSLTVHAVLLAATVLSATLAGVDVEPRQLVALTDAPAPLPQQGGEPRHG